MNKITILENKTLKLQNVLSVQVDLESEQDELFDIEINKVNTYIQTHGAKQIGPLIQDTSFEIKDDGAVDIKMQFMHLRMTQSLKAAITLSMWTGMKRMKPCV